MLNNFEGVSPSHINPCPINAYLETATRNHWSAYSYFSHLDKFVDSELRDLGMTGPFDDSPWQNVMISHMMTSHKKPTSRRPVFDASFGLYSLNKNTPEHCYHDMEYHFTFPTIENLLHLAKVAIYGNVI